MLLGSWQRSCYCGHDTCAIYYHVLILVSRVHFFFRQNVNKIYIEEIYIEVNECILFLSEISLIIILVKNEYNESMGCLECLFT